MLQPEWINRLFKNSDRLSALSDRKKDILVLLFFCFLMFLPGLGLRDPWPADEPRFALAAKHMVESGQWFFPVLGDEYYPDKPPMFMWMIAAGYALTGNLNVAFLIPSALAAIAVLLLIYDLGTRLWSRREGLAAATSLLIMVQFIIQGRTAQIDMVLTFWTTLALYGMLRHLLLGDSVVWFLMGSFCMGLGVITKGVGFLPIFLLVAYALALWRKWTPLNRNAGGWVLLSPAFMILGTLVWIVPMWLLVKSANDPALTAYRDNILFHQTSDRYFHSWGHIKPFWYYIVSVMPWAWLPFSLLIVNHARRWWARMKQGDSRVWTLVLWGLMVLAFFSFSRGKRGVYILPVAPVYALLVGAVQEQVFASKRVQAYFRVLGYILGGIFITLGIAMATTPLLTRIDYLKGMDYTLPPWVFVIMIFAGVLICLCSYLPGRGNARGYVGMFFNMLIVSMFLGTVLWPVLNPIRSPRIMMQEVQSIIGPRGQLGLVAWKEQMLLYADRPVETFGRKTDYEIQLEAAIGWLKENTEDRWLLIEGSKDLGPFDRKDAVYKKHLHERDWFLFRATELESLPGSGKTSIPITLSNADSAHVKSLATAVVPHSRL